MRKFLEILSLLALVVLIAVTASAFFGPARLPARIPAHFNALGQPDAWSSPRVLLLFPLIGAAIYGLMTWVSRYPSAFNYPVRVTPRNRERLEALALGMITWLKTEVVGFFAWMQASALHAAHHPGQGISPLLMPALLVAVFVTIIGHVTAMFRAARL